jgi:nicotinate-nucleotide pyrophosphorylase
MERIAITTLPRGSWKYQDAFGIAHYVAVKAKAGFYYWKRVACSKKYSAPQLRRMGYDASNAGGINKQRLTRAEVAFAVFAQAQMV